MYFGDCVQLVRIVHLDMNFRLEILGRFSDYEVLWRQIEELGILLAIEHVRVGVCVGYVVVGGCHGCGGQGSGGGGGHFAFVLLTDCRFLFQLHSTAHITLLLYAFVEKRILHATARPLAPRLNFRYVFDTAECAHVLKILFELTCAFLKFFIF